MQHIINLALIIAAGLMNGSFVIPSRFMRKISNETVWAAHSIIGLVFISWLILFVFFAKSFSIYLALDESIWVLLIIGGLIFGFGQLCFFSAIDKIGIALSFSINLGIGATIGSLFVLFYHRTGFTKLSLLVVLAVLLIVLSLFLSYFANKSVDNIEKNFITYQKGWLLSIFSGLASGFQNIVFVIAISHYQYLKLNQTYWVWPVFLTFAAIPMFLGFFFRNKHDNFEKTTQFKTQFNTRNFLLLVLMGAFFTGSLALYSYSISKLSNQELAVGWPALMISIIFASQIWGLILKERGQFTFKKKLTIYTALILLFIAIILLAIVN